MSDKEKSQTKEANPLDAQYGDWVADFTKKEGDSGEGGGNNRGKIEWMKFDKPGKYKVRLIGKYVSYLKHYKPFGKGVRIITHKSYKQDDPAWVAGFYPATTYVIHIIDRADGKLKLLDKGRKLFECFFNYGTANANWLEDHKIDITNFNDKAKDNAKNIISGTYAPNFEITVEWPSGNKNRAKYSAVAYGGPAKITEEEREAIKSSHVDLTQIYKSTPLAKIKEAWEAVPEQYRVPKRDDDGGEATATHKASNIAGKVKETTPPIIEENMDKAPAEEDDLFGDTKEKDETTGW